MDQNLDSNNVDSHSELNPPDVLPRVPLITTFSNEFKNGKLSYNGQNVEDSLHGSKVNIDQSVIQQYIDMQNAFLDPNVQEVVLATPASAAAYDTEENSVDIYRRDKNDPSKIEIISIRHKGTEKELFNLMSNITNGDSAEYTTPSGLKLTSISKLNKENQIDISKIKDKIIESYSETDIDEEIIEYLNSIQESVEDNDSLSEEVVSEESNIETASNAELEVAEVEVGIDRELGLEKKCVSKEDVAKEVNSKKELILNNIENKKLVADDDKKKIEFTARREGSVTSSSIETDRDLLTNGTLISNIESETFSPAEDFEFEPKVINETTHENESIERKIDKESLEGIFEEAVDESFIANIEEAIVTSSNGKKTPGIVKANKVEKNVLKELRAQATHEAKLNEPVKIKHNIKKVKKVKKVEKVEKLGKVEKTELREAENKSKLETPQPNKVLETKRVKKSIVLNRRKIKLVDLPQERSIKNLNSVKKVDRRVINRILSSAMLRKLKTLISKPSSVKQTQVNTVLKIQNTRGISALIVTVSTKVQRLAMFTSTLINDLKKAVFLKKSFKKSPAIKTIVRKLLLRTKVLPNLQLIKLTFKNKIKHFFYKIKSKLLILNLKPKKKKKFARVIVKNNKTRKGNLGVLNKFKKLKEQDLLDFLMFLLINKSKNNSLEIETEKDTIKSRINNKDMSKEELIAFINKISSDPVEMELLYELYLSSRKDLLYKTA